MATTDTNLSSDSNPPAGITQSADTAEAATTTPAKKTPKTLFSLPAELRNDIYQSLVLVEPIMRALCDHQFRLPALLQVNQQSRNEAWSIYYGENTFRWCSICAGHLKLIRLVEKRIKEAEGNAIVVQGLFG